MTSRTSSRSTSALLSNRCAEARFNNSLPISERTRANSAARRHESWWPSLRTASRKDFQPTLPGACSMVMRAASSSGQPCRRGPIERQLLNEPGIGEEEVGDCPLPQDIVTESHAVSPRFRKVSPFTSAKTAAEGNSLASSGSLREKACSASALRARARSRWFWSFCPSADSHRCWAISTSVRTTLASEERPVRRERRNRFRVTWRAGWLSARSELGAAFRNSSVSAAESSSITTVQPAPVG
jgi:hypothetical protein